MKKVIKGSPLGDSLGYIAIFRQQKEHTMLKIRSLLLIASGFVMAGLVAYFLRSVVTRVVFTEDELNTCAAEAALAYYMNECGRPGRTREDAESSLAVDGYYNIIGKARAYQKRFGGGALKTVYEVWAERAPMICMKHKLAGTQITMPLYGALVGYHITRSPEGSAAMVKDGDTEPQFGCGHGYHSTGMPSQPNGSGGCQPDH